VTEYDQIIQQKNKELLQRKE